MDLRAELKRLRQEKHIRLLFVELGLAQDFSHLQDLLSSRVLHPVARLVSARQHFVPRHGLFEPLSKAEAVFVHQHYLVDDLAPPVVVCLDLLLVFGGFVRQRPRSFCCQLVTLF